MNFTPDRDQFLPAGPAVHTMNGRPFAAPVDERSDDEFLEDLLLESGVPAGAIAPAAEALANLVNRITTERAAEAVRHIILTLPPTTATAALERAILGSTESCREAGERLGKSHVAVYKARKILADNIASGATG